MGFRNSPTRNILIVLDSLHYFPLMTDTNWSDVGIMVNSTKSLRSKLKFNQQFLAVSAVVGLTKLQF